MDNIEEQTILNFENSKFYKKNIKLLINRKLSLLYRNLNHCLEQFSQIDTENKLNNFCREYNIENINNFYIPYDYNNIKDSFSLIDLKTIIFFTKNEFMFNLILKNTEEIKFSFVLQKTNIIKNKEIIKENITRVDNIFFTNDFFINSFNLLKKVIDNNKDKKLDSKYIEDLNILLCASYSVFIKDNPTFIKNLDYMAKNKLLRSYSQEYFFHEHNIRELIQQPNLFQKIKEIYHINIIKNPFYIQNSTKNDLLFEDFINKLGFNKFCETFSLVNGNSFFDAYNQEYYSENKFNILKILEKRDLLKNFIKNDFYFLDNFFYNSFYKKQNPEFFNFLKLLEKKYNYSYNFFKIENKKIITNDIFVRKDNSYLENIPFFLKNSKTITPKIIVKLLKDSIYMKDKKLIDVFFINHYQNNDIYKELLKKFNFDTRKAKFFDELGLEIISYILSPEFREKHKINIEKENMINLLSSRNIVRKNKNIIDSFIEKIILQDNIQVLNIKNDNKRRL